LKAKPKPRDQAIFFSSNSSIPVNGIPTSASVSNFIFASKLVYPRPKLKNGLIGASIFKSTYPFRKNVSAFELNVTSKRGEFSKPVEVSNFFTSIVLVDACSLLIYSPSTQNDKNFKSSKSICIPIPGFIE
jgi:hypothetical protein